jgi:hypothetical protein
MKPNPISAMSFLEDDSETREEWSYQIPLFAWRCGSWVLFPHTSCNSLLNALNGGKLAHLNRISLVEHVY